jgi:hypothetical protein
LGAGRLLSREPDHICCHREDSHQETTAQAYSIIALTPLFK